MKLQASRDFLGIWERQGDSGCRILAVISMITAISFYFFDCGCFHPVYRQDQVKLFKCINICWWFTCKLRQLNVCFQLRHSVLLEKCKEHGSRKPMY